MIEDNEWHSAVICQTASGDWCFYDSIETARKDAGQEHNGAYSEVEYNWNNGDPVIDVGVTGEGVKRFRIRDGRIRLDR